MTDKHVVRFEPVGIEIEVGEDQTILRAAAEQGIMLMHGCKEGQCAACKSFVLDGEDIELDRYSTFALPDYEREEGFTLLCRAHVYEDVTIELLNYDEDMIRSGLPIQRREPRSHPSSRHAGHAARRARAGGAHRSSSTSPVSTSTSCARHRGDTVVLDGQHLQRDSGLLEFVIRVYPDGLFSHSPDSGLTVGDRVEVTGPFGVFTLREGRDSDLIFIGGGAGMAPILCLLRSLVERGITRKPPTTTARGTGRTCASRRSCERSRSGCRVPLRAGAVRADRRGRLGRRGRPHHGRRAAQRETSPTSTPTCAGRRRWSRRPCGAHRAGRHRRSGSTTTSSPRQVKPIRSSDRKGVLMTTTTTRTRAYRSRTSPTPRRGRKVFPDSTARATTTSPPRSGSRPTTRTSRSRSSRTRGTT